MAFCKSALGPLQDLLADAKGKCMAAETTVTGFETTLRWAEEEVCSVGEQLYSLLEGSELEIEPPEPAMTISKATTLCKDLVMPLRKAQAGMLERALQAEKAYKCTG